MMDPAVKTAMALCVVLGGLCAAMLFRREPVRPEQSVASSAEPLLIRHRGEVRPQSKRRAESNRDSASDTTTAPAVPVDRTRRMHRIKDGDTLAGLAERYLGGAARAHEIFEANRDVLASPELLPIGVELEIPPKDGRAGRIEDAPSEVLPSRPLVPVR